MVLPRPYIHESKHSVQLHFLWFIVLDDIHNSSESHLNQCLLDLREQVLVVLHPLMTPLNGCEVDAYDASKVLKLYMAILILDDRVPLIP